MNQDLLSPLSHTPTRDRLESSWDLFSMRGLGSSMKPWTPLVANTSISGMSWNSSLLSTMEHQGNRLYPREVVGLDTKMNAYSAKFGQFSKHHPTLSPSNEISVQQSPYSLLYATGLGRPKTRVKVPYNQFALKVNTMAGSSSSTPLPHFGTHTSQFPSWSGHGYDTEETHTILTMPLSNYCSCSPTCSASGATTRLNTMPRERSEASGRDSQGGHLVDLDRLVASSPSQLFRGQDKSTRVEEMTEKPYQCSSCGLSFAQRQGLTRHAKDTHLPKKRCAFCNNFAWPQGRRYIYRQHLQEEHPGFELPSISVTPRRGRCVKLKGQHFRENSLAHRMI